MKFIEKNIEWLATIAVVLMTTFGLFSILLDNLGIKIVNTVLKVIPIIVLYLLFLYQKTHYGIRIYDRSFFNYYMIYCIYILLDITVFRKYPLEIMTTVPKSLVIYIYNFVISIGYFICAKVIVSHFNTRKFLFLSVFICAIPSVLFIQFVGVDVLQAGLGASIDPDDEDYINSLAITYSNMPMLVLAVVFFKSLFTKKFYSVIACSIVIVIILYVLFVFGKRGPLLWSFVSIIFCFIIKSVSLRKYVFIFGFVIMTSYVFMDSFLNVVKDVLPQTGQRLETSINEGDTHGRFDVEDSKHSTYLIGLENFSRSPIWGYYFRLVTDYQKYRGSYAHNVFVEILMTMGLFGFIPFVLFLLKAYRKSRLVFTRPHLPSQMACFVFFLCSFFRLQTTGSCVFNNCFWLFFYVLCSLDKLDDVKNNGYLSPVKES